MVVLPTEPLAFIADSKQLYTLEQIDQALDTVAEKLNRQLHNQSVLAISVLQGGLVTAGHLLPKLKFSLQLDYVHLSRYHNRTQGAELVWRQKPVSDLQDQIILLIDDIFDEGITLSAIKHDCLQQGAKQVITVVLLDKQHDRKQTADTPDYCALTIPDDYVFGFGMDYQGYLRNAPGIFALKSDA